MNDKQQNAHSDRAINDSHDEVKMLQFTQNEMTDPIFLFAKLWWSAKHKQWQTVHWNMFEKNSLNNQRVNNITTATEM